jgi:hypothetical protein
MIAEVALLWVVVLLMGLSLPIKGSILNDAITSTRRNAVLSPPSLPRFLLISLSHNNLKCTFNLVM